MTGARLQVRVQPRSSRNETIADGDGVKIYVTAAAEGGKANEAAVSLLARRLGIPKTRVHILKGHRTRDKVLLMEGISEESALARLRSAAT